MALLLAAAGTDSLYMKTEAASDTVRILFTHDLQDRVEQFRVLNEENAVSNTGGYSFLASAIEDYRTLNTVVLDAGNFSAGTMYASLNSTKAPDLTLMKKMGYDAVSAGLKDFSYYGVDKFGEMLSAAESHPDLVLANMSFGSGSAASAVKEGWQNAGGSGYTLIDTGSYTVGVFGLCQMDETYGEGSPLIITDPIEAAVNAVSDLKKEGADLIVCLYSTDEDDFGELCGAAAIDVIIAGGTHTAEERYRKQGSTVIVSSDPYGQSLGVLDIDPATKSVSSYERAPVSSTQYSVTQAVEDSILAYRNEINESVMKRFGLNRYPVFRTPYSLTTYSRMTSGKGLGEGADLVTDSMIEAYSASENDEAKPVSIVTEEMITGTLLEGNVYPNDLFRMAANGVGSDGIPGYNLVHVYMYGKDLLNLCEMDLILHGDDSPEKMHFGRMYYEYSTNRPVTNQVIDVYTEEADGYYIAATDDRLYPVITTAEFLNTIPAMAEACGGELVCNVYDESGKPVTDYEVMALRNAEGAAVKVWSAIASYAAHFDRGTDGIDVLPDNYKTARKQRTKITSMNIIKMFKHANKATLTFYTKIVAYPIGVLIALYILVWLLNLKKGKASKA